MWYFLSHHMPKDGYGYAGLKILDALAELGAPVEPIDMLDESERFTTAGTRTWHVPGPAMALCVPDWWPDIKPRGDLVGYTMFESTRMPAHRVSCINGTVEVCLVPSTWCAETFRANGVRPNVRVVPLGIDPGEYWPLTRRRDGSQPYRFLWNGTPDWRKGWDLVYKAFWLAFQGSPDVELVMHFRVLPKQLAGCDDKNVRLVEGLLERPALRQMYRDADCFLFPSRGEGWGLPPREAAATGLPAIATDYGGLAEEIEHWGLPLMVAREVPAEFGGWASGSIGEWAEPDLGHLVELMRWCAENREAAARRGMEAADWLAAHGTWARTAREIMEVMEGC